MHFLRCIILILVPLLSRANSTCSSKLGYAASLITQPADSLPNTGSAVISVKQFGAVGDGRTDDRAAIQAAIDYVTTKGGGEVFFPTGRYGIKGSLIPKNGVTLRGVDMYNSVIYALTDNFIMLNRHNTTSTASSGSIIIQDLCLWGYGDRNPSLGTDAVRMARIGNSRYIEFRNVYAKWSRQMSLTASGELVRVENCLIENSFRDGINVTDCKRAIVTGNRGEYIYDDFIAVHVSAGTPSTVAVHKPTIISNNQFLMAQGIVVMGARECIITGNVGRMVRARGIVIGVDRASNEGYVDAYNVVISENSLTDVINNSLEGRPSLANAIQLSFMSAQTGTSTNAPSVPAGNYAIDKQSFVKPDKYWNRFGANSPKYGASGIIVANNVLKQTLSGLNTVADAGFKDAAGSVLQYWTAKGYANPAFSGTVSLADNETALKSNGIAVSGSVRDLQIHNNTIEGFSRTITFNADPVRQGIRIRANILRRTQVGIVFDEGSVPVNADIEITDNTINLDPYRESSDRNGASWNNVSQSRYYAISGVNMRGLTIRRNKFWNCKGILQLNPTSLYLCQDNDYYVGANVGEGIGTLLNRDSNTLFISDYDVKSNNYEAVKNISTLAKAGPDLAKNGIRFTGKEGQRLTCSLADIALPGELTFFVRLRVPRVSPVVEQGIIGLGRDGATTGGSLSMRLFLASDGTLGCSWNAAKPLTFRAGNVVASYAGQVIDVVLRRRDTTLTLFVAGTKYTFRSDDLTDFNQPRGYYFHVGAGETSKNTFEGDMFDTYVLGRALSDIECIELSTAGIPTQDRWVKTILYYHFAMLEGDRTGFVEDLSGNGHRAKASGEVSLITPR